MDCYYESEACQEIVSAMPMFFLVWIFSALMMLFCMYKWFSLELNPRHKVLAFFAISEAKNHVSDEITKKEFDQIVKKLKLDK